MKITNNSSSHLQMITLLSVKAAISEDNDTEDINTDHKHTYPHT